MLVPRAALIAVALLGCSGPDGDAPAARLEQAVIHGEVSPADQNAVVLVRNRRTGAWATGSVVAPNLVLTSKQLLFELFGAESIHTCEPSSPGTAVVHVRDAAHFTVMFGEEFPMRETAAGVRVFAGGGLDICRSNIALLELDRAFPITPLPLRLLEPPSPEERGELVGWGMSDVSTTLRPGSAVTPMGVRHRAELTVRAVGPDAFPLPDGGVLGVLDSTFVTDEAGCFGDAGAPFLSSKTGAIVGTLSLLEPEDAAGFDALNPFSCYRGFSTFHSLIGERGWMGDAFRAAGAAPWFEGLSQPAAVGAACGADAECASGHCLVSRSGGFCSNPCGESACDEGQQCLSVEGEPWCVPDRLSEARGGSEACAVSGGVGRRGGGGVPAFFLLLLLALSRPFLKSRHDLD